MPDAARPLLLVGGGKMGEALLAGWLKQGLAHDAVLVVEPDMARRERSLAPTASAPGAGRRAAADILPETLVLAVKPQMMAAALDGLRRPDRP